MAKKTDAQSLSSYLNNPKIQDTVFDEYKNSQGKVTVTMQVGGRDVYNGIFTNSKSLAKTIRLQSKKHKASRIFIKRGKDTLEFVD